MKNTGLLIGTGVIMLATSGCSLYGMVGDAVGSYAVDEMVPYVLSTSDLDMACEDGRSIGNLLMSFGRVTEAPHQAAVVTYLAAGMCAEFESQASQLNHIRALKAGAATVANDHRIEQKRAHVRAATRFLKSYQEMRVAYPGDLCALENREDQLLSLLGLAAGVQALLHDRSASGAVGVDMGILVTVARESECFNSAKWWGVPQALRSVIYLSVPGSGPEGEDGWELLDAAVKQGDQAGVRLARALLVEAAHALGQGPALKEVIRGHVNVAKGKQILNEGRLLDAYANRKVEHMSDIIWMEETGYRTPLGQLGNFLEQPVVDDSDDLFDGLDG
ncbi:MAG: hypothetical protein VYA34_09595 [Myxococcota bacterium]|nr:hypothetical protein [Myxococcota bacterium]